MNRGRFLVKMLLLVGVIVSLGLSYVTSPAAQPPATPTPAAAASAAGRGTRQGHAAAGTGSGHGRWQGSNYERDFR